MPAWKLTRGSNCPLYRQLYGELRQAIVDGKLIPGVRLPSTRNMARALRVSRNTVLNAYEALVADGMLAARRGSGTFVRVAAEGIRPLATPMRREFDLWAALREARFPLSARYLCDPYGNPLYIHR